MIPTIGRRGLLALGPALASPLAAPAVAQAGFPNRPIRLVIPWLPGGSSDTHLRVLAEIAGRRLGQPVWWRTGPAPPARSARR